jgi:hypothetical protein
MIKIERGLRVEINHIYYCVYDALLKKPVKLWGLSLLSLLLIKLSVVLGVIPLISLSLILLLSLGKVKLFYDAYNGLTLDSGILFFGFNKDFVRYLKGMGWMALWIFIWALIPFAGVFIAISKIYAYRFVPYILILRPEVAPIDALRLSVKETCGFKGRMFGADIIILLAALVLLLIIALLGLLPIVGWIFRALFVIAVIACIAFLPLIYGLLGAAFYTEISSRALSSTVQEPENVKFSYCPQCGKKSDEGQLFCGNCGTKL